MLPRPVRSLCAANRACSALSRCRRAWVLSYSWPMKSLPFEFPPLAHRRCATWRGGREERGPAATRAEKAAAEVGEGVDGSWARRRAACGRIMFDEGILLRWNAERKLHGRLRGQDEEARAGIGRAVDGLRERCGLQRRALSRCSVSSRRRFCGGGRRRASSDIPTINTMDRITSSQTRARTPPNRPVLISHHCGYPRFSNFGSARSTKSGLHRPPCRETRQELHSARAHIGQLLAGARCGPTITETVCIEVESECQIDSKSQPKYACYACPALFAGRRTRMSETPQFQKRRRWNVQQKKKSFPIPSQNVCHKNAKMNAGEY